MELGNNIRKLRIKKLMTQEDLALILGTTSKSISRWEQGLTYPDISLLPIIANVFEITVDELLGVEKINQNEYIKSLKNQAYEYARNNDYINELALWQEAYKKLPNNEEIKIGLINIMNTINVIDNDIKYSDEIIKLIESILNSSKNNNIRLLAVTNLVQLYSQMGNEKMAELYSRQLPNDLSLIKNIMDTRYLKDKKLLKTIQINTSDFISEIVREAEFIIYDNRMTTSIEYKKRYLEKLVKIEELICVEDDDYGYDAIPIIFNYIALLKLEIKLTNKKDIINDYFMKIEKAIDYIINFKPHMIKSPFMNEIECKSIGGYSSVISNLKNNILSELTKDIFLEYNESNQYKKLLEKIKKIK